MEVTFELLREAGVRLPRQVGQAVSIVGALVIGDAAVSAGLVSPSMVIVVAITAISSFAMPSYPGAIVLRLLRFVFMFLAGTLGLFGITLGLMGALYSPLFFTFFRCSIYITYYASNIKGLERLYNSFAHLGNEYQT